MTPRTGPGGETPIASSPIDFGRLMPKVAPLLLGKPNERMSKGTRLRFGTHGSMEIDTAEGWFDDHESNARGGVLELIQHKQGCDRHGALSWLEAQRLKDRADRAVRPDRPSPVFYTYHNADGSIGYKVERRGKGQVPPFLQHGPDGRGGFHAAKGCMRGVAPLPYRLPDLLAAGPGDIVFVVEGEKDADNLVRGGLVATTNSGGAGKFAADLAPHFAGRRVVIIADNDKAGRDHAADVAGKLAGVAASVAVLALPGLADKEDVSDWIPRQDHGAEAVPRLLELAEAVLHKAVETFELADLSLWASTTPTPKAFVMAPFIPRDDVVIVTGDGGTNKSTLALQVSACAAAGKQLFGMDVAPGPALYITAEDDNRENHWRLSKIATSIGTTLHALAGQLHVVSLRGRLNNELATFDHDGKLRPAPAYALLRATIAKTKAKLVTLDNVAHLFAGNENDRSQVTAFINLLYQLCGEMGVTILLIAHRNKAGDSYSGSTAWLNAVRSQVLLERSDEADADVRRMSLGKANYARAGEEVTFRWHDFALVRDRDLPADRAAELSQAAALSSDNLAFLACLRERDKQGEGRQVGPAPGPNYAPKQFEGMAQAKGLRAPRLKLAMDRLFTIGAIETHTYRNTVKGRDVTVIREAPDAPRTPTPNLSRTLSPNHPEQSARTTPPTHSYISISGAAPEGSAAPFPEEKAGGQTSPAFTAAHPNERPRDGLILAPGETHDDPVPGWDD